MRKMHGLKLPFLQVSIQISPLNCQPPGSNNYHLTWIIVIPQKAFSFLPFPIPYNSREGSQSKLLKYSQITSLFSKSSSGFPSYRVNTGLHCDLQGSMIFTYSSTISSLISSFSLLISATCASMLYFEHTKVLKHKQV